MTRIRFQGQTFLLVGDLAEGGAIATARQYSHGKVSYAHLLADGRIQRFGHTIGTRGDIEIVGEVPDPKIADDALLNLLDDEEWARRDI